VRIQRLVGDHGADDDFHLVTGSPGVDRGSPLSAYLEEPQPNGARVDVGAYGNTAEATASPAQLIQVLSLNGLEKVEAGGTYTLTWRSAGLTEDDPVALVNVGGSATDNWLASAYQTQSYSTGSNGNAIDTSGATDPAPAAVYQSYAYAQSGTDKEIAWALPVVDGAYVLRLHFAEPSLAVGQRRFDIMLQGATVADNFDIRAAAGAANKAVVQEYAVNVTEGQGIDLKLINRTGQALLNGIELLKVNADGVAEPTADVEVPIATGAAVRPGRYRRSWRIPRRLFG
jgi:Malectin domain